MDASLLDTCCVVFGHGDGLKVAVPRTRYCVGVFGINMSCSIVHLIYYGGSDFSLRVFLFSIFGLAIGVSF